MHSELETLNPSEIECDTNSSLYPSRSNDLCTLFNIPSGQTLIAGNSPFRHFCNKEKNSFVTYEKSVSNVPANSTYLTTLFAFIQTSLELKQSK